MNPVHIHVDASSEIGPMERIWRSFGYDEINWTYTPKGRAVFDAIAGLRDGPYWIRNHNAFTSGNRLSWDYWASTNCYTEDSHHKPSYDWSVNDRIYDVYLSHNCKPMIELDFMPHDLSSHRELGPRESWRFPPRDHERWRELNARFAQHLIDRYGSNEVRQWYFSPWNEPDIDYFKIDPADDPRTENRDQLGRRCAEYCKLYDYAVAGLLDADDALRIGGPDLAFRTDFRELFLRHCHEGTNFVTGSAGSRLDFISLHSKATGNTGGHVPNPDFDRTARRDLLRYFEVMERFPRFKALPLIGNEWDIDVGTPYGIYDSSDFAYRNTSYYPTYVIRSVKEILDLKRDKHINVELITQWAFYFEGKRCFEGTRALFDPTGIRKPVFNAFEMLSRMGSARIAAISDDKECDVEPGEKAGRENRAFRPRTPADAATASLWDMIEPHRQVDALASREGDEIRVLVWNQKYDQYATGERSVELEVSRLEGWAQAIVAHYRIDDRHSNAHTLWKAAGCPDWPSAALVAALREREALEKAAVDRQETVNEGRVSVRFSLPVHGVSMFIVALARRARDPAGVSRGDVPTRKSQAPALRIPERSMR